jgi:hypothetical protein
MGSRVSKEDVRLREARKKYKLQDEWKNTTAEGKAYQKDYNETWGKWISEGLAGRPQREADKKAEKQRRKAAEKRIRKAKNRRSPGTLKSDFKVVNWIDENGQKQWGTNAERAADPAEQVRRADREFRKGIDPRLQKEMTRRSIIAQAQYSNKAELLARDVSLAEAQLFKKTGEHSPGTTMEQVEAHRAAVDAQRAYKTSKDNPYPWSHKRLGQAGKLPGGAGSLPDWAEEYMGRIESDSKFAEAEAARPAGYKAREGWQERLRSETNPGWKGEYYFGSEHTPANRIPNYYMNELNAWEKEYSDVYNPKAEQQPTKAEASIIANPYEASHSTIEAPYNTAATRAVSGGQSGIIGNTKAGDKVYNPKTTIRNKIQQRMTARRNQKRQTILTRSKERIQ